MPSSIKLSVKNPNSKFAAIDLDNWKSVIAEGTTVKSVEEKASKSGKKYFTMFIPKRGKTYIF